MTGLLGGLFTSLFGGGYDPSETALARYRELTDFSSPYWKQASRFLQRQMADTQPSIDTLTGFAKSQGIDSSSAAALGYEQNRANMNRTRDAASRTLLQQMLGSEQLAQGYLGQGIQGYQFSHSNNLSFLNQLMSLGGGLIARNSFPTSPLGGTGYYNQSYDSSGTPGTMDVDDNGNPVRR